MHLPGNTTRSVKCVNIYHKRAISLQKSYGQMDGQTEARNGSEVIHLAEALMLNCQKAFSLLRGIDLYMELPQPHEF
jgi:hypothetical protein